MSHWISHAETMDQKHSINLCNHERYPVHLKCLRNIQKIKYPDFQAMTYINFQTKSGHLTDPIGEAIDIFGHTLDKTALVWFQTNRSKFKDLTTLKMMF